MKIFIKGFFLAILGCTSVSAETVGNLEFDFPVSIKEWSCSERREENGNDLLRIYERTIGQFKETLLVAFMEGVPDSFPGFDPSKASDIYDILASGVKNVIPEHKTEITDLVVEPKSIFYRLTSYQNEKAVSYAFCRDIYMGKNYICFQYVLSGDDMTSVQDLNLISNCWYSFLKNDLAQESSQLKK